MRKIFCFIALAMIVCTAFLGCKNVLIEEENKTGTIKGQVKYLNENVTDYSGIQVTLVSTNGLLAADYYSSRGIDGARARSVTNNRVTNANGDYSFADVPEGVYTIYASSNSSTKKAVATNVVVRAAQTVTAEVLGLTATGSIKGKVTVDGGTDGVLGLDVFIAGTSYIAKVGAYGSYEISDIPAKAGYVLCVQKGEYTKIIDDNVEVKADESVSVGTVDISYNDQGDSFKWLGSFDAAPVSPSLYDAYFNTTDGNSYIWNGSAWNLLARGLTADDVNKFSWLGSFDTAPENPSLYGAYFNNTDGCSYTWTGEGWNLLAQGMVDGTIVN